MSAVGEGEDGSPGQGRPLISARSVTRSGVPQVLLLGSGDSGKSTILKQMRLIHSVPFSSQEVESYRQLVFNNITHGLKYLLDAMVDMNLEVEEQNAEYLQLVEDAQDLRDGQPFPIEYLEPLRKLWADTGVQKCWDRGNEAALPEKWVSIGHDCVLMATDSCRAA
jgi:guanine nucleotide-binding protein subunit alpha, other